MRLFFICFFVLIYLAVSPQSFNSHTISLSPKLFPDPNFDANAYSKKLAEKYVKENNKELLDRYIADNVEGRRKFLNSNQIYTNWPEATEYLKKVFNKTVPSSYNIEEIKIVIIRDPDVNAYCMEDGNIAVTIGFLAWFYNEAFLASTLAHEYGHYYENHLFLDYKKTNKNLNIARNTGYAGALLSVNNLYKFKREQETQADKYSLDFFLLNDYNPKCIALEFMEFKKIKTKYEHLIEYRRPLIYFNSHPTDDNRISNSEKYFQGIKTKEKNYLVDSVLFNKIRNKAIDETIYNLFEQLRYDECLEAAYLQHLYQPKDEYYLFFIIECLRRQVNHVRNYAEMSFITGNYKNLSPDSTSLNWYPKILAKGNEMYLNRKYCLNSIQANMRGFIYNLNEEDIKRIKAKNLLTADTLEFYTNKDALAYFVEKMPEGSPIFDLQKKIINGDQINPQAKLVSPSELEQEIFDDFSSYHRIKEKPEQLSKVPVILQNVKVEISQGPSGTEQSTDEVENQIKELYNSIKQDYSSPFMDLRNRLNFREYNQLMNNSWFIESAMTNKIGVMTKTKKSSIDFDYLNMFPETSAEVEKYAYKKIILIKLQVGIQPVRTTFGNRNEELYESWVANIYCIDIQAKEVHCTTMAMHYFNHAGTRAQRFYAILYACESMAKSTK